MPSSALIIVPLDLHTLPEPVQPRVPIVEVPEQQLVQRLKVVARGLRRREWPPSRGTCRRGACSACRGREHPRIFTAVVVPERIARGRRCTWCICHCGELSARAEWRRGGCVSSGVGTWMSSSQHLFSHPPPPRPRYPTTPACPRTLSVQTVMAHKLGSHLSELASAL
jgi:hypothetical protein